MIFSSSKNVCVGGYNMPRKKFYHQSFGEQSESHKPLKSEMVGPEVSFLFETDINFKGP